MQTIIIIFIVVLNIALSSVLFLNWGQMRLSQKGIFLAAIMAVSTLFFAGSSAVTYNNIKQTKFCFQCHEMEPYKKSLNFDHDSSLVSKHFQNNRVPKKTACYSCHTEYTLFGEIDVKLTGFKHLFVHYTGTAPKKLKIYKKYSGYNCRYCHSTAKNFLEKKAHNKKKHPLKDIISGKSSCMTAKCHDVAHVFKNQEND